MAKSNIDFGRYSTLLFIDSMVVLEGKQLVAQPWHEIDANGPILIMVVPQVMKEIDKHKRDGRLGKWAREFNRLISPAAESVAAIRLADGPPAVDIALALPKKINWSAFDEFDSDDPDTQVVLQIINVDEVPNDRKILLSHDINPIMMGARLGLKTTKMPDRWLRDPEPSPHEKELMRLKGRVAQLEAQEVKSEHCWIFCGMRPLKVCDRDQLESRIPDQVPF